MTPPRLSELLRRDLSQDPPITGVTADSRQVRPGFLFAALPGSRVDGRSFIPAAIQAGAAAVLSGDAIEGLSAPLDHDGLGLNQSKSINVIESQSVERDAGGKPLRTFPHPALIRVDDPRRAYALAAAAFWGAQPAVCVAVTGTNGKTSVAVFCQQIFQRLGRRSASMGTLGVRVGDDQLTPPGLTTPDAADVARVMADLAARGVSHLALEASSHGVEQRRLDGVKLTAAGFLNLTQDHLDYHGTMGAYRAAKLRLFEDLLPRGATAVLNADSDAFPAFASSAMLSGHTVLSVGERGQALRLLAAWPTSGGQRLSLRAGDRVHDLALPLAGAFQAGNALVAAGLCIGAGEDPEAVLAALEHIQGAPGRLQRVGAGPRGGEAYVDYAHTPDGLETVLKALRPHVGGRLIVVFGAGGDRDRGKRPLMGAIAARLADVAIVTDDNPRSEFPAAIRAAILASAPGAREIGDRGEAIAAAAAMLGEGDVLVVAGKGHERGQIVGDLVLPFDDVAETARALGLEAVHG